MAVDAHRAPYNRGIGMKIAAPEAVPDHHRGIRAGLIAELPGCEQAAQFRAHSQHIEVVGCHRFSQHPLGVIERPDEEGKQIPCYGDPLD